MKLEFEKVVPGDADEGLDGRHRSAVAEVLPSGLSSKLSRTCSFTRKLNFFKKTDQRAAQKGCPTVQDANIHLASLKSKVAAFEMSGCAYCVRHHQSHTCSLLSPPSLSFPGRQIWDPDTSKADRMVDDSREVREDNEGGVGSRQGATPWPASQAQNL